MKEGKSCFNCKNASKDSGSPGTRYIPPEPAIAECMLDESKVPEGWHNHIWGMAIEADEVPEHIVAVMCQFYDPELVGECVYCRKVLNKPMWSHEYWATGIFTDEVTCSPACKILYEKAIKDEIEVECRGSKR